MANADSIKFEVIATPYYTVDGLRLADYDADSVKVGDVIRVDDSDDFREPDAEGDMFGLVERSGYHVDVAAIVLKRLS